MIDYEGNKLVWVSAGSLKYDREHNEFILPYLFELREGRYPLRHKETGYVGGSRSTRLTTAPFEKAGNVAIELDRRLARTGQDRSLVELSYCENWDDNSIAGYFNLEEWYVRRQIENAVSYISSGDCPRWLACEECGEFPRCRKIKRGRRKPVSYREWCYRRNRREGQQLGSKVQFL